MRRFLLTCTALLIIGPLGCGDDVAFNNSSSGAGGSSTSTTGGGGGMGGGGMGTGGSGGMGTGGSGGMGTGGSGGMGTGGSGGMGTGGSGGMGTGGTVMLGVTILNAINQAPVGGIEVCDHADNTNCATTNVQGQATLMLPDSDVTIDYGGIGYRPHLLSIRKGAVGNNITTPIIANSSMATLFGIVGGNDDPTKGQVGSAANVANASAALSPMSGAGPFYSDTNGFPNPQLTATTSVGTFIVTNATPGAAELAVSHPNLNCATSFGVVGAALNTAAITIEAGAITIVSNFKCQ